MKARSTMLLTAALPHGNHRHGPALRGAAALIALVLATALSTESSADIVPRYNIEGSWQADPTRPMQCIRTGLNVECTMNNPRFVHRLNGEYTGETSLRFTMERRDRQTGCVTELDALVSMQSADEFVLTWFARVDGCGLRAGQSGTDPTYHRVA